MCRRFATVCLIKSPAPAQRVVPPIAERLAALPDPRDRRGRRHALASVLLTACSAVAVDGKSARGSRTDAAPAAHLISAVLDAGRTVSRLRVPDKPTEVTAFPALLAPFDLAGTVVTADALHTQRAHAS